MGKNIAIPKCGKKGFTLVEVALVLVLVGLLIGGLVVAKSLLGGSKVSSVVQQIGQYDSSIQNFQQRFRAIPGDTKKFGNGSIVRNSNGMIEDLTGEEGEGSHFAGEVAWFWDDLETALGNNSNRFTNVITDHIKTRGNAINLPAAKFGSGTTGILTTNDYYAPSATGSMSQRKLRGVYLLADFSGVTSDQVALKDVLKGSIKPADALALDKKLDDSKADSGAIIALPETPSCSTVTLYNTDNEGEICALAVGYLRLEVEQQSLEEAPNNVCGDNNIGGLEECDDGNTNGGDGCDNNCLTEVCYNVVCNPLNCETCNSNNGSCEASCGGGMVCNGSGNCVYCGNSSIDSGEGCDDGNSIGGDGCDSSCQSEGGMAICGNSVVDGGEQCDDGNTNDFDGCSSSCQIECGDGSCNMINENCNTCVADCGACGGSCGNSALNVGEQCDDGNTSDGDGCNSSCQYESMCGDWSCSGGEDACSCPGDCMGDCCGNNSITGSEQCDDGNTSDGDGCNSSCQTEVSDYCGDGNCNGGETCYDGNFGCPDCGNCVVPTCGDNSCNGSETTVDCPTDCGTNCGDGTCNGSESTANCFTDCGSNCGDGTCNGTEDCNSCMSDCGTCDPCAGVTCGECQTCNAGACSGISGGSCNNGGGYCDNGSCISDPCMSVMCGSGTIGGCMGGTCTCDAGYSGGLCNDGLGNYFCCPDGTNCNGGMCN